jgi:S1-C subfamily serine protease
MKTINLLWASTALALILPISPDSNAARFSVSNGYTYKEHAVGKTSKYLRLVCPYGSSEISTQVIRDDSGRIMEFAYPVDSKNVDNDISIEKFCLDPQKTEISLNFVSRTTDSCRTRDRNSERFITGYKACNSNFYKISSGRSKGINVGECILKRCEALNGTYRVSLDEALVRKALNSLNLIEVVKINIKANDLLKSLTRIRSGLSYGAGYSSSTYMEKIFSNNENRLISVEAAFNRMKVELDTSKNPFAPIRDKIQELEVSLVDTQRKALDFKKLIRTTQNFEVSAKEKKIRAQEEKKKRQEEAAKLAADKMKEKAKLVEKVMLAQRLLLNLGYLISEVDGIKGLETSMAIKAFKSKNKFTPIDDTLDENVFIALQQKIEMSPVQINFDDLTLAATGSGFIINNEGYVVTNAHVISECNIITTEANRPFSLVKSDETNDVAILYSQSLEASKVVIFSAEQPTLGEDLFAAGYPLYSTLQNLNFTSGTLSSEVGLGNNISQFQMTTPIQPGNSGGPVINDYGHVVGMSVAALNAEYFRERGIETQNVNFGIKKSTITSLLDQYSILYQTASSSWLKPSKILIAKNAKESTKLIKCWRKK